MRVLVADDEWLVREEVKASLQEVGHTVVGEAGDGETALQLAKTLRPDVAVLDIKMPERDGIEVARELVKDGICAAVLLTAYALPEFVQRATEAGAFGYLTKPFDPKALDAALHIAVARFNEFRQLQAEIGELEEELATRKLVERAKGLLMKHYNLDEAEAYRILQRRSMETRKPMREVAEAVLMALELLEEPTAQKRKSGKRKEGQSGKPSGQQTG
ncbi:putative transcriptional regulatory protein pdtaR [bacterium HR17]|uniref:Putative transcriptional regulatory protein pdtaR n=1 Tax=Candidatus Fervidibacter japonicus TaxID=2035412 RepID=A0A2H5XCU1_9BACT|nr:putative transcriptional regulatory protein pdtaR [bacterium HR17]